MVVSLGRRPGGVWTGLEPRVVCVSVSSGDGMDPWCWASDGHGLRL